MQVTTYTSVYIDSTTKPTHSAGLLGLGLGLGLEAKFSGLGLGLD